MGLMSLAIISCDKDNKADTYVQPDFQPVPAKHVNMQPDANELKQTDKINAFTFNMLRCLTLSAAAFANCHSIYQSSLSKPNSTCKPYYHQWEIRHSKHPRLAMEQK